MKIAIYSGEIPSTTFVEQLVEGMAARGHEIFLFGKKKAKYGTKNKNIRIFYFPDNIFIVLLSFMFGIIQALVFRPFKLHKLIIITSKKRFSSIYYMLKFFTKYLIVLNNLPDIFHLQWIKQGHDWLFLKEFGVKVIGSFRGAHINYSPITNEKLSEIYKCSFPKYDAFHAVSYAIMEEAAKYGADKSKVFRIPGAVKKELTEIPINKKKFDFNNRQLKVLSVGREHWIKGYNYALETCLILKNMGVSFHYTIVGAKKNEELLYLIHDLGLEDNVELSDNIPHYKVLSYYIDSDIYLMSSLMEGIPNVVLEAMAVGVPVISTDCGGVSEVIKHEKNGWIVPLRDPQAMADIICDVLNYKWDLVKIVTNARKTIKDKHLQEYQLGLFEEMYSKILKNK